MTRLAGLPDLAMDGAWEWTGHKGWPLQGRDALYLSLLDESREDVPSVEPARLLGYAGGALGSLCGLLAGRPDDLLDRSPGESEWSIRQILGHILLTERRYLAQTRHAATRGDGEPVRIESAWSWTLGRRRAAWPTCWAGCWLPGTTPSS
jgi:hypothetical protein